MFNRRDLVMVGAALSSPTLAFAKSQDLRLQTRLFNFRDDVPPDGAAKIVGAMKTVAGSADFGGFLIGRNVVPDPFPSRFEWLYMIQFAKAARGPPPTSYSRLEALQAELSTLCRDQVECGLSGPTPDRFADAVGVRVRHTVMFDFKPEASSAERARNVDAIKNMGRLPMVQAYRVERSATYAQDPTQMEWQVIGDFASVADYQAYSKAPAHLAIRDDFRAHTARVAFLDVAL